MAKNILGYAAHTATSALAPFQFQRRDQRKSDVEIEIIYCGVCHSDLHRLAMTGGIVFTQWCQDMKLLAE